MSDGGNTTSGGIGFSGVLFIVFLILKLTHVIDWSWVWVFAPLWINLLIIIVMFVVFIIGDKIEDYQWRRMR